MHRETLRSAKQAQQGNCLCLEHGFQKKGKQIFGSKLLSESIACFPGPEMIFRYNFAWTQKMTQNSSVENHSKVNIGLLCHPGKGQPSKVIF